MTPEAMTRAVGLLLDARRDKAVLPELPEDVRPKTLDEGYDVQDAFIAAEGGEVCGYKIAATGQAAQKLLKVDAPFYGQVLTRGLKQSPARVTASDYLFRLMEPEFIFRMGDDLPARSSDYDTDSVAAAVASLHPGFELACSAYGLSWVERGAPQIAADDAVNAGLIVGPAFDGWRDLDLAALEVKLFLDEAFVASGSGANVLGHPLLALTWLANTLGRRGRGLKAGDYVSTGLVTEKFALGEAGQTCRADFGPLGSVSVSFD